MTMPTCPICSSDRVYSLLNTLHCKRCKHIWKEGEENRGSGACECPAPDTSLRVRIRIEPLETRMERRRDEYLKRSGGKFCITGITWQAGDISFELFRRYLKRCVKNRTLAEERDRYGRIWYRWPGTKN
jgi:hypothetical protein